MIVTNVQLGLSKVILSALALTNILLLDVGTLNGKRFSLKIITILSRYATICGLKNSDFTTFFRGSVEVAKYLLR